MRRSDYTARPYPAAGPFLRVLKGPDLMAAAQTRHGLKNRGYCLALLQVLDPTRSRVQSNAVVALITGTLAELQKQLLQSFSSYASGSATAAPMLSTTAVWRSIIAD